MGTIQKIYLDKNGGYVGYCVETSEQTIKLLIEDFQNCCESYGCDIVYETTNDMIGATVLDVYWGLDFETVNDDCEYTGISNANVIIETDRGNITLNVSNNHNGYYPHQICAKWKDYEDYQRL